MIFVPKNSLIHNRKIKLIVWFMIISSSSLLVIIGNRINNCDMTYLGVLLLFLAFFAHYLRNIREDIIILFFNASIFLFLLGRYLVRMIRSLPMDASSDYIILALNLVFVSLLTINIVYVFAGRFKKDTTSVKIADHARTGRVNFLINVGLALSGICAIIANIATYNYAALNGYNALYLSDASSAPIFIKVIADMLPFFVALYLAKMPSKQSTYILFTFYMLLQVPLLMAGKRMPFIVAILVWVSYVVLRNYKFAKGEKWISRVEKITVALAVPLIIIIIPLVGDIRSGGISQGSAIERTLDSQGVTLDVVSFGIANQNVTPKSKYKFYTLAPVLDYASTNFLTRKIFGKDRIPVQTKESAELGVNYADTISYLVLRRDLYLSGQGLGSSYIIETYIDFGIAGLVLYSAFLGLLFRWVLYGFGKNYLRTFFAILLMMSVYFLPRDTALGFVVSIFQLQTILLIGIALLYSKFSDDCKKEYV